jgi:hypothetical protein
MRVVVCLAATYLISSCARADYGQNQPDSFFLSAGPQPGYAIKQVIDKEPPAVLVGDDGSVCRTSTQRYRATALGKWIACVWTLPTLDSTGIAYERST